MVPLLLQRALSLDMDSGGKRCVAERTHCAKLVMVTLLSVLIRSNTLRVFVRIESFHVRDPTGSVHECLCLCVRKCVFVSF